MDARGDRRSDAELLAATDVDGEAFAVFYARHVRAVLALVLARTRRADLAADVCAEVFATALEKRSRYEPERGTARAWLLAMAANLFVDALRRGRVEDRVRRRLAMPARELTDAGMERIEELVDLQRDGSGLEQMVDGLPADQRDAVIARVVMEGDYAAIAAELACSEQVIRKRVSRGLMTMRRQLVRSQR